MHAHAAGPPPPAGGERSHACMPMHASCRLARAIIPSRGWVAHMHAHVCIMPGAGFPVRPIPAHSYASPAAYTLPSAAIPGARLRKFLACIACQGQQPGQSPRIPPQAWLPCPAQQCRQCQHTPAQAWPSSGSSNAPLVMRSAICPSSAGTVQCSRSTPWVAH